MPFYSWMECGPLTMTVTYFDLCLFTPWRIIGRSQWLWLTLTYVFYSWAEHRSRWQWLWLILTYVISLLGGPKVADNDCDLLWLMHFHSWVEDSSLTMTVNYIDLCLSTPGWSIGHWQWLTYFDICLFTPGWSVGRWQWRLLPLTYAFLLLGGT